MNFITAKIENCNEAGRVDGRLDCGSQDDV